MTSNWRIRALSAASLGFVAFVLLFRYDCAPYADTSPELGQVGCRSFIGYPRAPLDATTVVMWIGVAAVFGWVVLSTVRRVEIFAAAIAGGGIAFGAAVGLLTLAAATRDPRSVGGEGNAMLAMLVLVAAPAAGIVIGGLAARKLVDRRSTPHAD